VQKKEKEKIQREKKKEEGVLKLEESQPAPTVEVPVDACSDDKFVLIPVCCVVRVRTHVH